LTARGVKVLDCGLAKAEREDALGADLPGVTKIGTILGTINYLSPEQAQGKAVDAASDVFAFGAVLYEMCSGAKAFPGENAASIIAAILERQPAQLSAMRVGLPVALVRVVEQCLEKDPRNRPTNLSDAMREVETTPAAVAPEVAPDLHRKRHPSRRLLLRLGGAGALLAAGWTMAEKVGIFRPSVSRTLLYPPEGFLWAGGLALSPDGRRLVTVVFDKQRARRLWIRSLQTSDEQVLAGTEGAASPFWSPDSSRVGFFANGKLLSVSASGGSVQYVAGAEGAIGASWGSGGKILFGAALSGRLSFVSAKGGLPRLARGVGDVSIPSFPQFLPDGSDFLFSGWDRESGAPEALLGGLDSPNPHVLIKGASAAQFAPPDYLLFLRNGVLMAQRFDWANRRPVAEAFAVSGPTVARSGGAAAYITTFSTSRNGVLAYRTGSISMRQRLAWHSRDGRLLRSVGEPGNYMELFLSRDGRFGTVNMGGANGNLGLLDMAANTIRPITSEPPIVYDGVWSPDSRNVVFQIYTSTRTRIMALTVGETSPRLLLDDGLGNYPDDWSPDGKWIVAHKLAGAGSTAFLLAADGQSKGRVLFKTKGQLDQLQFSPDGRWLAYNSTESGSWQVYVVSYPSMSKATRISNSGGCQPIWRGDSQELFYLTLDGKLMAVPMRDNSPQPLSMKELFRTRLHPYPGFAQYGAEAAGQKFLIIEPDPSAEPPESGEPIHVMTDWPAHVRVSA
jgi:WD40 repeat protein